MTGWNGALLINFYWLDMQLAKLLGTPGVGTECIPLVNNKHAIKYSLDSFWVIYDRSSQFRRENRRLVPPLVNFSGQLLWPTLGIHNDLIILIINLYVYRIVQKHKRKYEENDEWKCVTMVTNVYQEWMFKV